MSIINNIKLYLLYTDEFKIYVYFINYFSKLCKKKFVYINFLIK